MTFRIPGPWQCGTRLPRCLGGEMRSVVGHRGGMRKAIMNTSSDALRS